jgi:TFIIF-interacting CTD phosphatase-like protein
MSTYGRGYGIMRSGRTTARTPERRRNTATLLSKPYPMDTSSMTLRSLNGAVWQNCKDDKGTENRHALASPRLATCNDAASMSDT